MKYCLPSWAAFLILFGSAAAAQDLTPEQSLKRMKVAEGFEVSLVASEPQIRQPLSLTFDERGRIWVIQYLQYPNYAGLTAVSRDQYLRTKYDRVPEPPPKGPKGADRITILEDTNGDGFHETTKDFVAGLNIASGLCLGHGGVFIAQPPYLLFYPDKNRDDVPDGDPEVLLTGFGIEDTHSLANSLQWGPDGWLYGAAGSTSTSNIRGIGFQQGVWRYHPITKAFELFSEGGGNTYGLDFDARGNVIAGTNHGSKAALHQVQGAYHIKTFAKHGPLHNPYTFGYFDHIPYAGFKGGHVTCGGVLYLGDTFPESFRGMYIAANPLSNVIDWHILERTGSTFKARRGGELLAGNDPWFRPVDCLMGPDGAIYVADWHDARLNHVDPRDNWDKRNGRIYRIQAKGGHDPGRFVAAESVEGLLKHRNVWFRREARRTLAESRYPVANASLRKLLEEKGEVALEALWAIYVNGGFDDALAAQLLSHPNEDVRAWTVRLLGDAGKVAAPLATKFSELARTDPSSVVRNQLACTAKRLSAAQGLPIVRELLHRVEDVDDLYIPLLIWWAIEAKAVSDRAAVLALLDSQETWLSPMMQKHLLDRLARRYLSEGGDENTAACATLLSKAPRPVDSLRLVEGMEQALAGRRLEQVPSALEKPLARLAEVHPGNLRVLRLAVRLGSLEAYADALRRAEDAKTADRDRIELVEVLGESGKPDCIPVFLKLLGNGPGDALAQALISGLQPYPEPRVIAAVLNEYVRLRGQARSRALGFLCSRPASAVELLKLVDSGKVDKKEIPLDRLAALREFKDAPLDALLQKHWGKVGPATPGDKLAQIHSIKNMIGKSGKGDPILGKPHFTKICAVCHTLFDEGNKIGPDLTTADRKNLDLLLNHIVDPNAMIRPEFQAFKLRTTDGQVLTGLLVEQTATTATLLDAQNNRTVIPQSRIDVNLPSETSLMPEKLLDPLKDDEIRHLLAYLQSDAPPKCNEPAAEPLKVCLVSGSLEYESDKSLAEFQEYLEKNFDAKCSRAFRKTDDDIPGLENLDTCDVVILFTRRVKPQGEALERVKRYFLSGKPVVGIRTASHAFQTWLELDKEVLGGSYKGHYGKGVACDVKFTEKAKGHPILEGVKEFTSKASLYQNPNNAEDTETLVRGTANGKTEPVAWTRIYKGGRVFYTSLGDQGDFQNDDFRRMLVNALFWVTKRAPERKQSQGGEPLPGTKPLDLQGDLATQMVAGIDKFLLREIDASVEKRAQYWKRDPSSKEAYEKSIAPNRERLKKYIGLVDPRTPFEAPEIVSTLGQPPLLARSEKFEVYSIRWPVLRNVQGEGLLLSPVGGRPRADLILMADPDHSPEMSAGLAPGLKEEIQLARRFAESGVRVFVPVLIDRRDTHSVSRVGRATNQPHREFAYRPAFEMGRHVIGYEVQKVLALVDWLHARGGDPTLGIAGYGEGGLIALYAAAVDPRIDSTWVGGYFESRQKTWQEPIYRNVWRLLEEFGDAEVASLILPRALRVEAGGPSLTVTGPATSQPGRSGAAPGVWESPKGTAVEAERERLQRLTTGLASADIDLAPTRDLGPAPTLLRPLPDFETRMKRQLDQIVDDTQHLLREAERTRDAYFWKKINTKGSLEEFEKGTEPFRKEFYETVNGKFDAAFLPPNPRSRQVYDEPKYRGYEVMLDVWPDVYAYGVLLVPKDLKEGERRPVVVCQHGLEGRPQDLADVKINNKAYNQYACRLAERGFIVFAPQNPYIGRDLFRTLQRKANLLGKHLFSIIIPQHQVITDWLAGLPFVDPERIAFYGLSYGGKTAMRVPAVVKRYCLSICSADFNEWIWKNAAIDSPYSYVTTGEYEIFEWNLGNTFNYAEMAALIAPRPFMVERGHYDGVAPDERVAYEYAKIRRFYAELKIPERTEIEFFLGPHTIHGVGTFEFLHRHLRWPKP